MRRPARPATPLLFVFHAAAFVVAPFLLLPHLNARLSPNPNPRAPLSPAVVVHSNGQNSGSTLVPVAYDLVSTPQAFFYPTTGKGFILFNVNGPGTQGACASGPARAVLYLIANADGTARARATLRAGASVCVLIWRLANAPRTIHL